MVFTVSQFPYVTLCPNLMTVQTSKGKIPHTYKELIRRIRTFDYEKLLLLKSPQNILVSNIVFTKKKASQTYHRCQGHYEIKLLILQMS